jgi:hypothetical protein
MSPRLCSILLLANIAGFAGCAGSKPSASADDQNSGIKITRETNVLRVTINGALFTEYHFKDVPRPYFYPVIGPDDLPMTRNWPMRSPPNEKHDHPHHRSLWFGHGSVNGQDFWGEEKGFGKIVHDGFTEIKYGPQTGVIKSRDQWIAADGTLVCTDDRTFRIYNQPGGRLFDFEITIHASHGNVTFGDSKEGSMAIRLAESMDLGKPFGHGHILNSNGLRDGKTWGKRADWCDYYGPVNGKIVGVAIFDNPKNPRHPTTWHVRDYGLFAANPFGLHEFEKLPVGAGDLTIPAGQSVTFRYRFYMHEGDAEQGRVAEMYQQYIKTAR